MEKNTTDELAQILWRYHNVEQDLSPVDAILVLGSKDLQVAKRGAEVFLNGYAPLIIFSGKSGEYTKDVFPKSEAEVFADVAVDLGVPRDKMLLETQSTNTGENISFTKKLLEEKDIEVNSFIVVQKPYMLRRSYATFMKVWPGKELIMTAPQITFESYPNDGLSKETMISALVGYTQRIKEYPKMGFQVEQEIPDDVWEAYEELVKRGFTKHLIK